MNPARLTAFQDAYAPAVLRAVVDLNLHRSGRSPQEYALDAALAMLDTIERRGVEAVEHYVINTRGGAFRHTAEALGVEPTARALQGYLEG
jgi:hypothetical protein